MLDRAGEFEIETCRKAAALGCRLDGRAFDEHVAIEINTSMIAQSLGSAEVRMGAAHVLVGIKAEVESPEPQHPDEGRVCVGVEISACAAPDSDTRDLDGWGAALAAQLQRLMFGRHAAAGSIDTRALAIIAGRSCWTLYVDCLVLSAGGALADALSVAVYAALRDTQLPAVSVDGNIEDATAADIEVDDDPFAGVRVDVTRLPVVLGVCQIGRHVMLGCTVIEEAAASGRLLVAVDGGGRVCGVQKSGRAALDISLVQHMISAAQKQGLALMKALHAHERR